MKVLRTTLLQKLRSEVSYCDY